MRLLKEIADAEAERKRQAKQLALIEKQARIGDAGKEAGSLQEESSDEEEDSESDSDEESEPEEKTNEVIELNDFDKAFETLIEQHKPAKLRDFAAEEENAQSAESVDEVSRDHDRESEDGNDSSK